MNKKPQELVWGEIGPGLVKEMVEKFSMQSFMKAPEWFCPIPGCLWHAVLNPEVDIRFNEDTRSIHLWNEMWRRSEADKDESYDPNCFYEKLKKRYL
jgi:hypothetical protein